MRTEGGDRGEVVTAGKIGREVREGDVIKGPTVRYFSFSFFFFCFLL